MLQLCKQTSFCCFSFPMRLFARTLFIFSYLDSMIKLLLDDDVVRHQHLNGIARENHIKCKQI